LQPLKFLSEKKQLIFEQEPEAKTQLTSKSAIRKSLSKLLLSKIRHNFIIPYTSQSFQWTLPHQNSDSVFQALFNINSLTFQEQALLSDFALIVLMIRPNLGSYGRFMEQRILRQRV
jgi:hypothetical protein